MTTRCHFSSRLCYCAIRHVISLIYIATLTSRILHHSVRLYVCVFIYVRVCRHVCLPISLCVCTFISTMHVSDSWHRVVAPDVARTSHNQVAKEDAKLRRGVDEKMEVLRSDIDSSTSSLRQSMDDVDEEVEEKVGAAVERKGLRSAVKRISKKTISKVMKQRDRNEPELLK